MNYKTKIQQHTIVCMYIIIIDNVYNAYHVYIYIIHDIITVCFILKPEAAHPIYGVQYSTEAQEIYY